MRVEREIQIRWRDLDAMQHVNDAVCVSVHLDATKLRSAPPPEAVRVRLS